jgi:hypothetical protein
VSHLLALQIGLTTDQVIAIAASIAALAAGASALIALLGIRSAIASNREAVEAVEIPFLIPDPGISDHHRLKFEDVEPGSLRIPLRNVGMGPAILGDVQFVIDGRQILAQAGGQIAFPAEDQQSLPFQLRSYKPDYEENGELRIYYTHASGKKYLTRCQVKTDSAGVLPMGFRRQRSDGKERPFLFWPETPSDRR